MWSKCGQNQNEGKTFGHKKGPTSPRLMGSWAVAPTGIDPVTFRFSVERSTN
jgi:hypothetical protein